MASLGSLPSNYSGNVDRTVFFAASNCFAGGYEIGFVLGTQNGHSNGTAVFYWGNHSNCGSACYGSSSYNCRDNIDWNSGKLQSGDNNCTPVALPPIQLNTDYRFHFYIYYDSSAARYNFWVEMTDVASGVPLYSAPAPLACTAFFPFTDVFGASGSGAAGYLTTGINRDGDDGITSNNGAFIVEAVRLGNSQAGSPNAVLSISKTHSGDFTQGQQNASYSVTVSNAANAAQTGGMVTVTETVPSGLTLVSMSGTGWTCGSTTCTRSDALVGGSSYPAITVTVNVAGNATSPQVNQVGVSGGGSVVANASDTTNIVVPAPATITNPANGSTLPGSSVTFQFSPGTGVTQYWLTISKVGVGGAELFNADPGPGLVTSKTINGLPTDGSTIYVSLYSHIGSNWTPLNYTYGAAGGTPAPATMTSPPNGSTLPGSSVTFQWTPGTGVTQYWLTISKVGVGGAELFNADPGPGLVTSKTINGLPTDGSTIYVSLYSHIGSNWPSRDYAYAAFH